MPTMKKKLLFMLSTRTQILYGLFNTIFMKCEILKLVEVY